MVMERSVDLSDVEIVTEEGLGLGVELVGDHWRCRRSGRCRTGSIPSWRWVRGWVLLPCLPSRGSAPPRRPSP